MIVFEVCRDFLVPGAEEPVELSPFGPAAIRAAIEVSSFLEDALAGLEEVLLLAYSLEGKGDSPRTAQRIRSTIAEDPIAMAALGIEADARAEKRLRERGRRIARKRSQPKTELTLRPIIDPR
jgi:hypothetical protein